MTLTIELDPAAIRTTLTTHRQRGTDWAIAWGDATGHRRPTGDERSMYSFMESHFRAAYYNTPSSLGRCTVPERDVSEARGESTVCPSTPSTRPSYCRSGDGCDRLAVRGKWGKNWCEHHGAELERLSVTLDLALEFNPPTKRAA